MSNQKNYEILVEGNSLTLFDAGSISFDEESLSQIKKKQGKLRYFPYLSDLRRARKEDFKGRYNMTKTALKSLSSEDGKISLGYSLFREDAERIDYASVLVSTMSGGFENPRDMYSQNDKGIYLKMDNNQTNALGVFALMLLSQDSVKNPEDLEILLVKRSNEVTYYRNSWSLLGGYVEPEQRVRLSAEHLRNCLMEEIIEEGAVSSHELNTIVPVAVVQHRFDAAVFYFVSTTLPKEQILERKIYSEINKRMAVPIKELESFLAENYFDPHSQGILKEVLNKERLIDEFIPKYRHRD